MKIKLSYSYDPRVKNRTEKVTPFGTETYSYGNGSNEMTQVSYNDGKLSIGASYDGNGNLLTENYNRLGAAIRNVNYSYNSEGKLSGINYAEQTRPTFMPAVAGNTLNFSYDDFGNRIKKTVNGTSSYYLNNGVSVLNELNGSGIVQKSIVQGIGQIAEIDSSGVLKFIHTDVLGSTVMVTDTSGAVVQAYEYEAFGEVVGSVSTDSSADTKYLFTGQEYDFESELTYMNARYYSATLGRFIARDPVIGKFGDVLSRNGYIYVKNNPLKYTDPTGMEEESILQMIKNSELFQRYYGFGVGIVESGVNTGKSTYNFISHPIQGINGMSDYMGDLYDDTVSYGKDLSKNPKKTLSETKVGLGIIFEEWRNDFLDKNSFDQGKVIGNFTESAAEIVVMEKLFNNIINKASKAKKAGITVLGSYDKNTGGYIDFAKKIDANYFDVPPEAWNKMKPAEQWKANKEFLDIAIKKGDNIVLSTSAFNAKEGTSFYKELKYLYSQGYKPAKDGMSLIKP